MKTALVTGGSRGIGSAIVRRLAREGWRVAFSYCHSTPEAERLSQQTGALRIRADLRHETEAEALARGAIQALGHLDAAVLNAGVSHTALLQETAAADWDGVFSVNLRGAFLAARGVIPSMIARKKGCLLFISSVWGLTGSACEAAYAASKAGMIGLARSLAAELGPSGIRVNSLAPGMIQTDMTSRFGAEALQDLQARCLLHRLGQPEDVAAAAAFLLGDGSSYITGQTLGVDGGFR